MMSFIGRLNRKGALTALMTLVALPLSSLSFTAAPLMTKAAVSTAKSRHDLHSLNLSASSDDSTIQLTKCSGEEADIKPVASFMVDAFWLQSPQQLVEGGGEVTESTRTALMEDQTRDLMDKYGERLGKRLLDSCLLTAMDGDELLGAVGIEVCLFNKANEEIIGAEKSEAMIKNAVASLGPKQRRQYKDSTVQEIATELLPPEIQGICCLSNLCVSPNARRKGIAKKLCDAVEATATEWGYTDMFLKVETENTAAQKLYENKLGYATECTLNGEVALRVDPNSGFVEKNADTLILKKSLQSSKEQAGGYI